MARFTYSGPVQTIALAVGKTKGADGKAVSKFRDFAFVPGRETPDLPKDNPIIEAMISNGLLTPVEPKSKPAKPDAESQGEQ